MKVLHVISGLRAGGAEHFVLELCRESLKDEQADMSVLSLSAADEISYNFRDAQISVVATSPSQKRSRGVNAFKGFLMILKHPANIVHAHMFHACIIACFAKLIRPSVRIVFTLHNNYLPQFHRRILLFLTRPLRSVDIVFPGMKRKWFHKKSVVTIANGVDLSRFDLPIGRPPVFTCAFVGRLDQEKNPLFLVDLAKSLLPEHNLMFRVAGEGPLKNELQKSITEEKLSEHFIVHGYMNDVATMLTESHCLVLPSLWEGMPLVMLEAAAAGIPVIATPVGNIPFLLNKENGYIGELESFRSMITEVMDNYGEALIKAGKLMRRVANEYSIRKVYLAHRNVYTPAGR